MPGGRRGRNNAGTPPLPSSPKAKKTKIDREAIPEFDPADFHGWDFQMKVVLSAAKCWGAIDHQSNQWATKTPERKEEMACTASLYINLSLGRDYRHICAEYQPKQAKELYERIRNMFIKDNIQTRLHLTSKLADLSWTTDDHVDSFLGKIAKIRTAYRNAGVILDEMELFCRMLDRLPQEFDLLKLIMQGWAAPDFDRARTALLQYQENLRKKRKYESENPLSNPDSSAYVMDCKRRKREENEKEKEEKKVITCYYCFRSGHYRNRCQAREDDEENGLMRACIPDEELPKHLKERKKNSPNKAIGEAHIVADNTEEPMRGETSVSSFRILDDDDADGWAY